MIKDPLINSLSSVARFSRLRGGRERDRERREIDRDRETDRERQREREIFTKVLFFVQ